MRYLKKVILFCTLYSNLIYADYTYTISDISNDIKKRMLAGNTWREGCPVALNDLRYLQLTYINFDGEDKQGELIVHQDVAEEVTQIFEALYYIVYPINKMQLISNYKGNDFQSIEADNTSAFNCRALTGNKNKWSNHAYGKAIDINPIENPYISKQGKCSHSKSKNYLTRQRNKPINTYKDTAMILPTDKVIEIFYNYGWRWGGNWKTIKDYQHFDKK